MLRKLCLPIRFASSSAAIGHAFDTVSRTNQSYVDRYSQVGTFNYKPLPVVVERGKGIYLWDVEGKQYFDFLSSFSSINQGHCHPRLVEVMKNQIETLTLTASGAFHNNMVADYFEYMTELFGYQRILAMNTGVEAVDTAIKLARRWAYDIKKVPKNEARIIFAKMNFHGRSITGVSASTDLNARSGYGPFVSNFDVIPFNDVKALERVIANPNNAAFVFEPIQGEGGIVIPDDGYLQKVRELCTKHNVLMVADEIQTGLGRTGRMLACDHESVRPDIVTLSKSLSGGMYPVSAVLADDEIMLLLKTGQHGSTYAANPLACRIAIEALQVIIDEKLCENAETMGNLLRHELSKPNFKCATTIRGKGLLTGIVIHPNVSSQEICAKLASKGLLAKDTQGHIIRLAPPLIIKENELRQAASIITETLSEFEKYV
ncbi:Ornithine--oxo-acid aminotransferase [Aphelenchoides bicaudatus]|nr:Ornithine--oxo-acid aminotransferase [Aphelenchoides bicaudatus]